MSVASSHAGSIRHGQPLQARALDRPVLGLLVTCLALWPALGLAQEVLPVPSQGPGVVPEPEAPEAEEELEAEPPGPDPRVEAAREEARQLRIRRQTELVSDIPTEGELLGSLSIPAGLLSARGLRYGSFLVMPAATVGATYSDNFEADDENREDDLNLAAAGVLRAQTLLARHQFGIDAVVNSGYSVQDNTDEFVDWRLGTDGRLDLSRKSSVFATLGYSQDTEDDSSAEAEGNAADIDDIDGSLGYDFSGNRIDYLIDFEVGRQDFSGNDTDDRDNTTYQVNQQLSWRPTSRLTVFVAPQYAYATFDEDVADDGAGRDAHLATALVGADLELRVPITLSGSVGYSEAFFEDDAREDTGSLVASGVLGWQIDPATALELAIDRNIELTTVDDSSARTDTGTRLTLSRLLGANAALSGELGVIQTDFNDLDRIDYDLLARIEYFLRLTDHLFLNAAYQYSQRFSDENTAEYYENQGVLGFSVVY